MKLTTVIKGKLNKLNKTLKNEISSDKSSSPETDENASQTSKKDSSLSKFLSANSTNASNSSALKLPSHETHTPSPLQQMIMSASDRDTSFLQDLTNDELDLNTGFTDDEYEEDSDVSADESFFNLLESTQLRKVNTYSESISHGVTFYRPLNQEHEEQIKLDQMKLEQYKELLDKASNSNTTILLELNLDGTIKYLSDHLFILHSKEYLSGQAISNFLAGSDEDKKVFNKAIELLLRDDESYKIKFNIPAKNKSIDDETDEDKNINHLSSEYYQLEAQGILIHDMFTNEPSFTMWIIKPIFDIDELDELPNKLVETLGFGATIFSSRLNCLEGIVDIDNVPADKMEMCRICENKVADWWLETHCRMCLYEHNLYDKITGLQEKLKDIKYTLIELKNKIDSPNSSPIVSAKDFEIDVNELKLPTLFSTLNLFIDFCDDSLNINNSELNMKLEGSNLNDIQFQFSPKSQSNIQSVKDWKQRLFSLVLQIDEGLSDSQDDLKHMLLKTLEIGDLKVTRLLRLKHTQQYHLRLKTEIFILTSEVIYQRIQSNLLNINLQSSSSAIELSNACLKSPAIIPKDKMNTSILNENFVNNGNKLPMLAKSVTKDSSLTPSQSNKDVFVSANESEGNVDEDNISINQKLSNLKFSNNSNDMFSSSTTNTTPNRKRTNSDLNAFSLSEPLSPSTTGENYLSNNEILQKINSPNNIPNISVATSILQRRSSVSSARHSNTNPKRSSPLVSHPKNNSLHVPSLSIIQKNPTTKSVFVKSPLTSPYLHALESTSSTSLSNTNNTLSLFSNSGSVPVPPLELHKTSIGSVISPGMHSSPSDSKIGTPNRSESKAHSSSSGASILSHHSKPKIDDYEIVKPISKGAFGSVFLAKRKVTGDYVSIKCLKKSDMISKNQVTNVKNERAVMMAQTQKAYVAHLYATFQNKDHLFLVMQYLIGGDLRTLIKMIGPLPSKWVKQYTSEIIFGVADMHQDGIIHHDLKPDNLLLDRNGHVKFIDFGLSRIGLLNRQKKKETLHNSHSTSKGPSKSLHKSIYHSPQGSLSNLLNSNRENLDSPVRKHSDDFKSETASTTPSTPYSTITGMTNNGIVEASYMQSDDSKLSFSLNQDILNSNGITSFLKNINSSGTIPRAQTPPKSISPSNLSFDSSSANAHKSTVDPDTDYVIFNPDDTNKNFKFMGTPDYIAPEVIKGGGETPMCDWWSVGCILFEFHFAFPPFNGETPSEVFENILKCNIKWPEFDSEDEESLFISPEAKDLILKLLVVNPKERLGYKSIDDIKDHPYFDDLDWDNVYQEEAEFVPSVTDPEDTDYFDNRGLLMNVDFQNNDSSSSSESENEFNSNIPATIGSFLKSSDMDLPGSTDKESGQVFNDKDSKPVSVSGSNKSLKHDKSIDFGAFNFRNIRELDRSNREVINRLKNEHLGSLNGGNASKSLRNHIRQTSLSSLLSNSTNNTPSAMNLVLSEQQKKMSGLSGVSDFDDSEILSSAPSTPMQSATENLKLNGPAENLTSVSSALASGVKFQLPNLIGEKITNNELLMEKEEERIDAVSKLNVIRKSRKFSNISQSIGNNTSRRASASSISTGSYGKVNNYDGAMTPSSSLMSTFSKNTMSFNLDVLVCESIPIHSYLITKNLEQFGCRVVNVSNGDELVRRATSDVKFDLIFTTFFSSKLNCYDIFKLIRNTNGANCNTPFIVITAYYQEAVTMNVFDNVLEKPVSVSQMRSILSKYALKKAQECEDTLLSDAESESDIYYDSRLE
ncbi:hypothetical protein QEN19_003846 [Hanseniaspora menglaensis]